MFSLRNTGYTKLCAVFNSEPDLNDFTYRQIIANFRLSGVVVKRNKISNILNMER